LTTLLEAPHFVLVAGEASGDQLGAGLIDALRKLFPSAQFSGVGGACMLAAGLEIWFDAEELAVMGLFEVLAHLPGLMRRRKQVIAKSLALQPDVYIGIDAPDFNLAIEKTLKASGICTVHYVSPSIWAWRQNRAQKIGLCADKVLCLFPFEPALYHQFGVAAEFVGHPLADQFPLEPAPTFARATLGLPLSGPILALLPGSRNGEVQRLARDFLDAAALIKRAFPKLTVIAPMVNAQIEAVFDSQRLPEHSVVKIAQQAQLALQAADIVIVASGTAALEAALARKPMVVAYRLHPITYFLARQLGWLKSAYFSLPNKLAGRCLVPELEQNQVSGHALAELLIPVLQRKFVTFVENAEDSERMLSYLDMHLSLRQNADERAADAIAALLAPALENAKR